MKLQANTRNVKSLQVKSPLIEGSVLKEKGSLIFWASISFIVFFLFIAPFSYKNGPALFNGNIETFEGRIYGAVIWGSIFLLALAGYFWGSWRLRNLRDVLSIAVWTIPLFYLLSLIPAASHQLSTNMALISVLYALFFLLGSYMTRGKLGSTIIQFAIMISGYYIVLFGYMNMFGNTYYKDAVMFDQGLRITSVFQYANAYAAFLMAIFFGALYLAVSTRKWYWVLAHSLMLIPIMSSFWLTQSRGAYVLLPIIFVLILPFVSLLRQILMSLYLIFSVIVGVLLTNKFIAIATPINSNNNELYRTGHAATTYAFFNGISFAGWGRLILTSLLIAVIITLIHQFVIPLILKKFANKEAGKYIKIIFPICLVILGVIGVILLASDTGLTKILPDSLRTRVENINFHQHSVLERGTFYKDAIKLVKDYPFGSGGGGWATLYEKYQNNPYTSNQAHNFLLQYLVEVGIIGFIALIGFLGLLFYLYFKHFFNKSSQEADPRLIFYIVGLSILVHSVLDFDLSYVYLASLVFLCFGGMAAAIPFGDIKWRRAAVILRWRWIYPGVVTIIGLTVLIITALDLNADHLFKTAQNALVQGKPYTEITASLDAALKLKPTHPEMVLTKINLMLLGYDQTKDESFYNQAVKFTQDLRNKEPYNRDGIEYEYTLDAMKQQTVKMHELLLSGIHNVPWDTPIINPDPQKSRMSFYERLLNLDEQLGVQAINDHNDTLKEKYFTEAKQTYARVQEKAKQLLSLPKGQNEGRDFNITSNMQLSIGQIDFYEQKYTEASAVLKPAIQINLTGDSNRKIARYYIAALIKQRQNDQALYDRLIASDAKEKDELNQLTN